MAFNIGAHLEARRAGLLAKASPPEILVKELLGHLGYSFIHQHIIITSPTMGRIVDFYLPDHRLIIEVDGRQHDAAVDRLREAEIRSVKGYAGIRFCRLYAFALKRRCGPLETLRRHLGVFIKAHERPGTTAIPRAASKLLALRSQRPKHRSACL